MTRPTIALDLRWMRPGRADGIGRYTAGLARALLEVDDPARYLWIFDDDESRAEFVDSLTETAPATARAPTRLLTVADFLGLPNWLRSTGVELVHVPNLLTSPFHSGYRCVATLHDLIPWQRGGHEPRASWAWRAFFATRLSLRSVLRGIDEVISVSDASRRALLDAGVKHPPITVVPNGVELPGCPEPASGGERDERDRFLLYVGRLDPYKNVEGWFREYATMPPASRREVPILLCGAHEPVFRAHLEKLARDLSIDSQVRFLGKIDESELDRLYRDATLLVHPSKDEGFGLTILEAMARGTPVVAYAIPAILELTGSAARLADPLVPGSLASAVRGLLDDPRGRRALGEAGRARAAAFTWRRTAIETRAVYDRLLAKGELRG